MEDRDRGSSLVQLLIGLLLSAFLIAGALQWFVHLKKTLQTQKSRALSLESERTMVQYLISDLKNAGYRGCRTQDSQFPVRRNFIDFGEKTRYFRLDRIVYGFQATPGKCQGRMPATVCKRLKENSDLLVIHNVPGKHFNLRQSMHTPSDDLYSYWNQPISKDAMVLISDCHQGDVFIASDVNGERISHGTSDNETNQLSKNYPKNTEAVELLTLAYYLGIPLRHEKNSPMPLHYSLYRDDLQHEAEEILEGIIDFQVQYIFHDVSNDVRLVSADKIAEHEWPAVSGIQLKIKTITNQEWEVMGEIRNWQRVRCGADYALCNVVVVGTSDRAGDT